MTMTVNRTDCSPDVGADLRVRPPGGGMNTHTGIHCGPGMDGWRTGVGACPLANVMRAGKHGDTMPASREFWVHRLRLSSAF